MSDTAKIDEIFNITLQLQKPLFTQIVHQFHKLIASDTLSAGQEIPSIRKMSVHLRVNPNTVQRAYAMLEEQGIVCIRQHHTNNMTANALLLKQVKQAYINEVINNFVRSIAAIVTFEELMKIIKEHTLMN